MRGECDKPWRTRGEVGIRQAPLFNARATAGLFVIALCYLLAWLFHRDPQAPHRRLNVDAALVAAQVITLALLTGEINAYWSLSEWTFERQLMLSATWGLFALVLIVVGLRTRYAPIRYFAILVFSLTIAKVFFVATLPISTACTASSASSGSASSCW